MYGFDGLSLLSGSCLLLGADIDYAIQRFGHVWMKLWTRNVAHQSLTHTEQREVEKVLV
jgi:hypothetical protein